MPVGQLLQVWRYYRWLLLSRSRSCYWCSCLSAYFLSDTDYLKYLFPQFVKSNLYHLCYTSIGQRISICNYWNGETQLGAQMLFFFNLSVTFSGVFFRCRDMRPSYCSTTMMPCKQVLTYYLFVLSPTADPHHRDLYVNSSDYLALLNSERPNPNSTGQNIPSGWSSCISFMYANHVRCVFIFMTQPEPCESYKE